MHFEERGWSKPFSWLELYSKDRYRVYPIESPTRAWHVEKILKSGRYKHLGNYPSLEKAMEFVDSLMGSSSLEVSSTEGLSPKWNKYKLSDFAIAKNGKPFLYATLTTRGIRGLQPRKKPVFFPSKIIDGGYVIVPKTVVDEIERDTTWILKFPSAVEQMADEAYAVIKTASPYGAKAFTVVGDRSTAARVAKIKNKTLEDDSKHTYIYRKMDEVNSEKYNIPVNEGVEKMKGLVDKLLALGGERPELESAEEGLFSRNSENLRSKIDKYAAKHGSGVVYDSTDKAVRWDSSDNKLTAMINRYNELKAKENEGNAANEGYAEARPNENRLLGELIDPDWKKLAEELLAWMSDDEVGRFAEAYGYFDDEPVEEEAEEGLTEKDKEVLDELPPEQPIEDSQSLDEEQGKPVKSATEKKSICEEYDEMEKELFEAMNRNSITDFQASVSDSISRIGSLGTIQLLLDSELADSFQDELFFIKNTYDLSDTQLVSQAILDAAETLLEDGELERAVEILKNSSEEENEEEFGEYEEPEDWSEVDQVEEGGVEEPAEGEPEEGEEITEEETEVEEENI